MEHENQEHTIPSDVKYLMLSFKIDKNGGNMVEHLKELRSQLEKKLIRLNYWKGLYDSKKEVNALKVVCTGRYSTFDGRLSKESRKKALEFRYDFSGEFRQKLDSLVELIIVNHWGEDWDSLDEDKLNEEEKALYKDLYVSQKNNPYSEDYCKSLLYEYIRIDQHLKLIAVANNYETEIKTLREDVDKLIVNFTDKVGGIDSIADVRHFQSVRESAIRERRRREEEEEIKWAEFNRRQAERREYEDSVESRMRRQHNAEANSYNPYQ